jgi:DNA-binding NarL/FixJ family response regulator
MVVQYKDFWKWAEKNKQMLDFSKIEKGILGPEPAWVEVKRNADFIKKRKIKKSVNDPWTTEEENILRGMLNAYTYTYPEIAQRLNRSEGAIKRRILDLGLKARPIRFPNHTKYTPQEVELIVSLFDKGHCLEDIASRINKSALGIRGKLERMGYKFRNGVPFKKEQKSDKELLQKWV